MVHDLSAGGLPYTVTMEEVQPWENISSRLLNLPEAHIRQTIDAHVLA
jgi:hypothetical protein